MNAIRYYEEYLRGIHAMPCRRRAGAGEGDKGAILMLGIVATGRASNRVYTVSIHEGGQWPSVPLELLCGSD